MNPLVWGLLLLPFLFGKGARNGAVARVPKDNSPRSDDDAIEMKSAAIAAALAMDAGVGDAPVAPWMWLKLPSGKYTRIVIRNGRAQLPETRR